MTQRISAEKYELEKKQLQADYKIYSSVENSEKLKEYLMLKQKVQSDAFKKRKEEIEKLQFKGSSIEKVLKEHTQIKKNRKIKRYLELSGSAQLARYYDILDEGVPLKYEKAYNYVKSGTLKSDKANFKSTKDKNQKWEDTDAYKKYREFNELKKSDDIRFYLKFKRSRAFKNYEIVKNSSLLNQLSDLEKEVTSDKFKERKAYLEDKNRYEKTEDFKNLKRFEELENDEEIQVYNKYHSHDSFSFFRSYSLTFEDDFEKLNTEVWSTITPIALKGPGKNITTPNQLSILTNGESIRSNSSNCIIITQKENSKGLTWNNQLGFIEKEFEYSGGLLHSLNTFKQEYGYFEIKFRAPKSKGVAINISLINESEVNCIRIASIEDHIAKGGIIKLRENQHSFDSITIGELTSNYEIIGLNWTPDALEWSLNGEVVGQLTSLIPHASLGIRIETEVTNAHAKLPHQLEIDWIKCYQKK